MRGLRRDAEKAQIAETVSKAHALFPRFSQERGTVIIHAPGFLHIGGAAYFVWAYPLNGGCTAQRHGEVHRRTISALTTLKQLLKTAYCLRDSFWCIRDNISFTLPA